MRLATTVSVKFVAALTVAHAVESGAALSSSEVTSDALYVTLVAVGFAYHGTM